MGLVSRIFAALWPQARIIALEPGPDNFAMLQLNAQLAPNIRRRQVGSHPLCTMGKYHEAAMCMTRHT